MKEKVQPKDYYDFFPPSAHRTGDIWSHLPNFGLLRVPNSFGLIVSPACDLAQRKTDTVTYLPIVTVEEYLNSASFFSDLWQDVSQQLAKLKFADLVNIPARYELPLHEEICEVVNRLEKLAANDENKKGALARMEAYSEFISKRNVGKIVPLKTVCSIFSSGAFEKLIAKLVKNSYRVDVHFLPSDEKPVALAAVPGHSLVLFRCALSIPISLLDEAQLSDQTDWPSRLDRLRKVNAVATAFKEFPVRLATLKDDFLSDLLSRYVSMQIRLGSRDFTDETVSVYTSEMMENQ